MSIELEEPRLITQVKRLAADSMQPPERVLETAVQRYLDDLEAEAIHAETEAFWAMHADLVAQYLGQHVAIYKGKVVGHDDDVRCLEARIRDQFGAAPVLIAPVRAPAKRELRWRGGRIEKLGIG